MTETWTHYLQKNGAQFENNTIIDFGQPEEERQQAVKGNIITHLSHFGLIKMTGNEVVKFLQGQFTNDVKQVTAQQSQLSAWCNAKGRIMVNFRLFKRDEAYYLLLPQESLENILKRLRMFVLRADVKLEPVSETLFCLGMAGTKSTQILTECLGFAPPTEIDASITANHITILTIRGPQPRYLLFTETPQTLWECATQIARPIGASAWQLLDILAGTPQIVPATAEEFVPQMVNYQAIGGVSFKKGCYTGQEIVARMQYLGTLKRRMYLAKINTNTPPQPGEALYISDNVQNVGQIVNAQIHPDGGVVVLAVIQISHETKEIFTKNQPDKYLQLMDLPYSLGT
jgi:tRNA-modifying protein YgfZ